MPYPFKDIIASLVGIETISIRIQSNFGKGENYLTKSRLKWHLFILQSQE
jgi:hypothetical protein